MNDFEHRIESYISKNKLLSKSDRIVVAASGGKDSTTILYLLKKWGYNVTAVHVNLLMGDYSDKHVSNLTKFCSDNNIPFHVVNIRDELGSSMCFIRSKIQSKFHLNNCMICGVIKRSLLNKTARALGANKIVTGHNLDDLAESVLMNLVNGNPSLDAGLKPKTGVISSGLFIDKVKPLNETPENDIRKYSKMMNFPVLYDPCPCSSNATRRRFKNLIDDYEKDHSRVKKNLAKSLKSVQRVVKPLRGSLRSCSHCGEPASSDVCQSCRILGLLVGN